MIDKADKTVVENVNLLHQISPSSQRRSGAAHEITTNPALSANWPGPGNAKSRKSFRAVGLLAIEQRTAALTHDPSPSGTTTAQRDNLPPSNDLRKSKG